MSDHYNKLTPAEAERLAMLIEECGEVIQAATKVLRHGYDSYHPDNPGTDNRHLLCNEIADLQGVLWAMERTDDLLHNYRTPLGSWKKKLHWTHHQKGGRQMTADEKPKIVETFREKSMRVASEELEAYRTASPEAFGDAFDAQDNPEGME